MVGVLEEIKIKVNIKEGLFFPSLTNFGSMIDNINDLQCEFSSGKVYGIIGECGSGGWALSYLLSGRDASPNQKILVNNQEISQTDLKRLGWYVGDGLIRNKIINSEKSVLKQLQLGVKHNINSITVEEIVDKFNLSHDRLHKKLNELSWEKWRASIAIGYAHNKRIFCFPWLNTAQINDLILNTGFHIYTDILREEGSILIVPTNTKEALELIADEYIVLNNARHVISNTSKELLSEYFNNKHKTN